MREILFRGKTYRGEWVEGNLIVEGNNCGIIEVDHDDICQHMINRDTYLNWVGGDIDGIVTLVDPNTVGQFTGLFDADGKKIFEGDIVNYRIMSRKDGALVDFKIEVVYYDGGGFKPMMDFSVSWKPKVVGNMYDNPELIPVKTSIWPKDN